MSDWATVGMVRGYVSSQAFIDHYGGNTALAPDKRAQTKSPLLYDTRPYQNKYAYLGATGRRLIIDLLNQCQASDGYGIDVLAYDLDEPDIIRAIAWLAQNGRKVRVIQDNYIGTGAHHTHCGPVAHGLMQGHVHVACGACFKLHRVGGRKVARVHGVGVLPGCVRRKVDTVERLEWRVDGVGVFAGLQGGIRVDGRVERQPVGHPVGRTALRRALDGKTGQISTVCIGHVKGKQHRAVALIHLHLE